MHKKFAYLLLACLFFIKANAQNEKIFNKLNSLYTLDKYEECIKKAESYIKDKKDGKDAYPYLYSSMSYFAIYQNPEQYDQKKYKDPLRKAVSFAGKYYKRDKSGALLSESQDFLNQLQKAALKECAYMKTNDDQRNLQNLAREMVKDYPKDYAILITAGTYLLYSNAKAEGDKAITTAMDSLKKKSAITDTLLQREYVDAFLLYAAYLAETKDTKKAKTVIKFANDFLPENEEIKSEYDKLYNTEATKPGK